MTEAAPVLRELGLVDYEPTFERMRRFSETRAAATRDELWLLQHRPVFTQGRSGNAQHLLDPGDIAVVQTDRGGQVTYHGPGQCVVYLLVDLGRRRLGVRDLVDLIESAVIELLGEYGIEGHVRPRAPGVYVAGEKIAALGLRIHRGCSYHGLALNVDMDLEPFARINPCGYEGLAVTSMTRLKPSEPPDTEAVGQRLLAVLSRRLMRSGHA